MSNILRTKHKRKVRKRFDLTGLNKTLEGLGFTKGFCTCLGTVVADPDNAEDFDLDGEDLTVEVELHPSGTQLTVRVGSVAGGQGLGIWGVPPVGAEVLVAIPDGDLDFEPLIVSFYSTGQMPSDVGPLKIVISAPVGGEVYIHDGSGDVSPLVKQAAFDAHIHPTGVGPSDVPTNALPDSLSYTEVLKAK